MKLSQGTLRPGWVLEVLEGGSIKASVPNLFLASDKDKLPPIMAFPGAHPNTFSQPKEGDEVWVLNFNDNPLQLYWFRKDRFREPNQEIMDGTNVDILINREIGPDMWASIFFSDGTGWVMRRGDVALVLTPDGSIRMDGGAAHRVIEVSPAGISLGSSGKSAHPAVHGDVLTECMQIIAARLNSIATYAKASPYTMPISQAIGGAPNELQQLIPKLTSTHVTLD